MLCQENKPSRYVAKPLAAPLKCVNWAPSIACSVEHGRSFGTSLQTIAETKQNLLSF